MQSNCCKQLNTKYFHIEAALAIVAEGKEFVLPVGGVSMLPFIIGGKERVVLSPVKVIEPRKVYLALTDTGIYVIHRLEKIEGDRVKLMGDGNLKTGEFCNREGIKAQVDYVIDSNGKQRYLYSGGRMFATRIWLMLKPLRRYLLVIYKKLILK